MLENLTCAHKPDIMDPQASFSCTGNYSLTQDNVDQGVVVNEVRHNKTVDYSAIDFLPYNEFSLALMRAPCDRLSIDRMVVDGESSLRKLTKCSAGQGGRGSMRREGWRVQLSISNCIGFQITTDIYR